MWRYFRLLKKPHVLILTAIVEFAEKMIYELFQW